MSTTTVTTFAPLRVPEYRRIWNARLISSLGTFLQLTAAPWLMNELTGSPLLVSLVTTALTLPRLLLTLPAGVLADALDRRALMIVGQATAAAATGAMAVLTAAEVMTPTLLLTLSLGLGAGNAITIPAFQVLVPDLVPPPLRAQAITLSSAQFNVARAVGPSLGGALVAVGLTETAFGLNAASYLVVIGVLLTLPRQVVEDAGSRHLWRAAVLGMRYVRFTRPLLVLIALTGGFTVTAISVQSLLPSVASDELGLDAAGFGLLYAAFGTGALLAALTRERVRRRAGRWLLPAAVAAHGLAGIVFGLAPAPLLAGAALAVSGLTWVWVLVTLNSSVQLLSPRWVRGRVVSIYLLAFGLQPVGALIAGLLAEPLGPGPAVAVLTAATATLGVVALRADLPVLGEIAEPQPPEDWVMPRHAVHVAGTPVLVATTWEVEEARLEAFFDVLRELRRTRLRTGAQRWSLYRDADRPCRITELFLVPTWEEHLAQHGRMDAEAAGVLARARAFDTAGGPVTRHLAGLDIVDRDAPAIGEQLLTVHEQQHRTDGSVPLD